MQYDQHLDAIFSQLDAWNLTDAEFIAEFQRLCGMQLEATNESSICSPYTTLQF